MTAADWALVIFWAVSLVVGIGVVAWLGVDR